MPIPRIVLDTNVFVSALRSRKGASYRLLSLVGEARFILCLSVPLVLEYEDASCRVARSLGLRRSDINDIIDYVCRVSEHREVHYLWRPLLRDPDDDMILELAVESDSDFVVTHNVRDFQGCEQFGVRAVTPREFLHLIGASK
jgi:putative PIN family toxin of toxin-antitoxin system